MKAVSVVVRRIAAVMSCGMVLCTVCLGPSCRHSGECDKTEIERAQALQELRSLIACADSTMRRSNQYPPAEVREFAEWLLRWNPESVRAGDFRVNREMRCLCDPWYTAVILLVDEGSVVGLASAGQNRTWEQGRNDDIVVYFRDLEVRTGRAGSPWRAAEDEKPATRTGR